MSDISITAPTPLIAPVLGVQTSGSNKVLQVIGSALVDIGSIAGWYIGSSGFVSDPASAVPIQGGAGPSGAVSMGSVTVAESALTTLSLGVRRVTVAVTGAVTTGNYLAFPSASLSAGYGIVDAICTTNGQITFGILVPVLTLGGYSISLRVYSIG